MKRTLPLFVLLLMVSQVSFSQLGIGVKGGVNITKIDGRSFQDEFNYGYHLGGFISIPLSSRFGLQPEVLFNQYQTKTANEFSSIYQNAIDGNENIKLNYLSIPLLLTYKFIGPLSLQAGPQFGVLIDKSKNPLQNGQQAFDKGDFSMLGGAQINLGKLKLTGRYFVGLNDINDIDNQDQWKNEGFQLSLGIGL